MIRLVTLRPIEETSTNGSNAEKGGLGAATKTTSKQVTENTKESQLIASLTGTRASAVEDFIDKHNINGVKLATYIKKGNLKDRMKFVTAIAGNPGNKVQKFIIDKFGMNESINEDTRDDEYSWELQKYVAKALKGKKIKGWSLFVDQMSGAFEYEKDGVDMTLLITPMWDGNKYIPLNAMQRSTGDELEMIEKVAKPVKFTPTYVVTKDAKQYIKILAGMVTKAEQAFGKLNLESVNEASYNEDLGHYYLKSGKVYVDSNFINKSSGMLPNSELKHMGFGEFYIDSPNGDRKSVV